MIPASRRLLLNATVAGETWGVKLSTPLNQSALLLGSALKPGAHVLVIKSEFMFSECFPENPPATPGNWGVDALISVQPKKL